MASDKPDNCWKSTGSAGDRSCQDLDEFIDCRNCPTYSAIGWSLLDRPPPEGYLGEWTELLAAAKEPEETGTISIVAFRLAEEWIALKTRTLKEVVLYRPVHKIPHRTNATLLGIVNVRGELLLCASLFHMLGIDGEGRADSKRFNRMIVIEHADECWVFPVDEVDRVYRVKHSEMEAVPVTVAKDTSAYSRAIARAGGRRMALLDEDLLMGALRRSLRWQMKT
jgi:chemotaxis-related protein WspD